MPATGRDFLEIINLTFFCVGYQKLVSVSIINKNSQPDDDK